MTKKKLELYENNIKFLTSIFLTCPECGSKCYIKEFKGTYFIIECMHKSEYVNFMNDVERWKITFEISEID